MRPSIYRALALELMEMGSLRVQDSHAVAQILAEFAPDMQQRVSARRQPDGTWRMEFDQRREVTST